MISIISLFLYLKILGTKQVTNYNSWEREMAREKPTVRLTIFWPALRVILPRRTGQMIVGQMNQIQKKKRANYIMSVKAFIEKEEIIQLKSLFDRKWLFIKFIFFKEQDYDQLFLGAYRINNIFGIFIPVTEQKKPFYSLKNKLETIYLSLLNILYLFRNGCFLSKDTTIDKMKNILS